MTVQRRSVATGVVFVVLMSVTTAGKAGTISQVLDTNGDGIPDTGGLSAYFSSLQFDRYALPGQAINHAAASVRVDDYSGIPAGSVVEGYRYSEAVTNCSVNVDAYTIPGTPVTVQECPQGAGAVSLVSDNAHIADYSNVEPGSYAAGDYVGRFFDVSGSASAGGNQTSALLFHLTSDDANFDGYFSAAVTAQETQQLVFNMTGSDLPEYVGIDVDLSLAASLSGNWNGSPSGAQLLSRSSVRIIDLDSFALDGATAISGSVDVPFSASASVNGFRNDSLDGVYTVLLRPNTRYEVELTTSAGLQTSATGSIGRGITPILVTSTSPSALLPILFSV